MPVDPLGIFTAQSKADPLGIFNKKPHEKPIDFASKYGISNKTPQEQIIDYGKNVDEGVKAKHEENVTEAATNSAKMFFENNPSLLKSYNLSNKKGTGEKFSLTQLKNATPFQQKVAELKTGINNGKYIVSEGNEGQKVTARPKGNLDNFVSGVKDAWNATQEANEYEKLSVDDKIKKALERKPDEYLPEKSDTQSISYGAGSAIPSVGKITAGAATGAVMSAAAPETFGLSTAGLSGVTAWLMSVPDMAKQGRMNAEIEAIQKLKQAHPDWNNEQIYGEAQKAGLIGYTEGLATGTAMNFIGGGLPANTGQGLWKAAGQFLRNQPQSIAEITSLMGGTTYAGEKAKQALGIPITDAETWDKVGQSMTDAAKMQLAFNVAHGLIEMPKYAKAQANEVLSKIPTEQLNNLQQTAIHDGVLTQEQVDATNENLNDYKAAQKKIIPTGNDEKDAVVTGLIQKKNNLEKLKTETDKSYHDEIDAQIENADQRIQLAKNSKDPIKYAEQDDIDGTKHFATKPFEDLSNKEIEGIVVPKEYGETDVKEIGEGEDKRYKPIATVINKKGGLEISDKIPVEDKDFSSKEQAQKAADKALAQHYYENGMDETLKPEKKSEPTTPKVEESVSSVEDFYFKNGEELAQLVNDKKAEQKKRLIDVVGKDWYDKYVMATHEQRRKMEDALSDEQKKVFGGVGVSDADNPEVIKEFRKKVVGIESSEEKETLASYARQAVTDLANKRNEKESVGVLNAVVKRANELGIDKKELQQATIKDLSNRVGEKNAIDILNTYFNETKPQEEKPNIKVSLGEDSKSVLQDEYGNDIYWHGSDKEIKGQPKVGRSDSIIKTKMGGIPFKDLWDAFYVTKEKGWAEFFSPKRKKVHGVQLKKNANILDLSDVAAESTHLKNKAFLGGQNIKSDFSFQKDFDAYAFDWLNKQREKNGKPPLTKEEFKSKDLENSFRPTHKNWFLDDLGSQAFADYAKEKGYDAVKFGREIAILNPDVAKFVAKEQSLSKQESGGVKNEKETKAQEPNQKRVEGSNTSNEPSKVGENEKGVVEPVKTEEITNLEKERDSKVKENLKEETKVELIPSKKLVEAKDPIEAKKKHDAIKESYKTLKKLIDCL